MSFESLGLSPELRQTVKALGYAAPTPVQRQAIPKILAKSDLIAIAQTGTGKTAAFALPLLQNLLATPRKHATAPRALILTPTRELALQVYDDLAAYGKGTGLTGVLLHGGVSYGPQLERLEAGVDIVVATPGRLRDHIEQKNVWLADLEILVLDEADRMLDMGFSEDVGVIIGKTARQRQTLLFSATFSDEVRKLAQKYLVKPASIESTPQKVTAQNVVHTLHPVDPARKLDLLFEVVHKHLTEQILVFARTKDKVDEVAKDLISRGLVVMATHGDRTQAHRTKAMARFKEGKVQILVATDIAARGLDTSDLGIVVNYELPNVPEDYVHRIGRTGRAGKSGLAISLVTQGELRLLAPIEKLIKFKIPVVKFEGFTPLTFAPLKARPASAPLPQGAKPNDRGAKPNDRGPKPGDRAKRPHDRAAKPQDRSPRPGARAPARPGSRPPAPGKRPPAKSGGPQTGGSRPGKKPAGPPKRR